MFPATSFHTSGQFARVAFMEARLFNFKSFAAVATVAVGMALGLGSANAAFVTGAATLNGVGQLQFQPTGGATVGTYTGISFASSSNAFTVGGSSGDLAGFDGATGTIKDFTYVPFSSITNFLLILSPAASFDATAIDATSGPFGNGWSANGKFLNLEISGILHISGFDDTLATLTLAGTFTNAQTISWSGTLAAQPVSTPEPATLALIGAGLAGMGMMRRRKKA